MRCLSAAVCLLLVSLPGSVLAWSNHSLGSALALQGLPSMQQAPEVKVEALEDFLRSEAQGLQALLDEQEAFALANFPGYPARPAALRWQVSGEGARQRDFLKALRISPEIKLANFVQALPGHPGSGRAHLDARQVTVYKKVRMWGSWSFLAVQPGEEVAPLVVVASGRR